ncbi:MAG: hypothetical protein QM664_04595 [Flavihumibacter sp.]
MKQYFFGAAIVLAAAACNGGGSHEGHEDHAAARKDGFSEKPATTEDSLYKLVIDGHDEAMARMGRIKGLKADVETKLDSVKKLPAGKLKEELTASYKLLGAKLDTAYQSMNNWMKHFDPDSAKADAAKRVAYLQGELDKVNKVKEAIAGSLSKADSLFK